MTRRRNFRTKCAACKARSPARPKRPSRRADVDAIAILAGNLRRKVEAGAPYADELAALTNLGVDKDKLAVLAAYGR